MKKGHLKIHERERKRKPSHPGRILKEFYMKPLKLTIKAIARRISVEEKEIREIVEEMMPVTPDVALRLAEEFDTTSEVWINLQKSHENFNP